MNNIKEFDVIVIGGGPGGYPAAIRVAQNGLNVALVEAFDLGGTCLNRGCIPTKALISNADVLKRVQEAKDFGVITGEISFDFTKMIDRKDRVVEKVRKGLEGLIRSNKITLFRGFGEFISKNEVKVTGTDETLLKADKIIIATGSEPRDFKAFPVDHKKIHDSTSILNLKELPKKIIIIGGGVIGSEFASLYNALEVEVVLLEMMPEILPLEPKNVSMTLTRSFKKKGIIIHAGSVVETVEKTEKGITVKLGNGETIDGDIAIVAIGRKMNTDKIGLDKIGVKVHPNGIIETNEKMETSVPHIYAVGDIASKWWLAHVASHQGLVAGNNVSGKPSVMHYNAIPSVIFTEPEIGTVGLSLEQAIEEGFDATVGQFPFQALGKAQASSQIEGFAQIVQEKKTGQILGAQIVGHEAGTLIAEMGIAIANELTVDCITQTVHAHPTIAEVWLEAALMAAEEPLHLPPKRKSDAKV
ncbi:dihydrolipoyl dehydrogenase [Chlamydiales bacterium]|nr:dihydrolipoyl dehydrogenase [Chlamydiales bacterium]